MLYQAFSQTLIWAVLTRSFISQGHKEIACAATYTSLMQPESQLKRGDSIYFGLTRTCLMTTSLLDTWRGVYSVAHLLNHSSDWQFSGTYTMLPLLKKKTNRFLPSRSSGLHLRVACLNMKKWSKLGGTMVIYHGRIRKTTSCSWCSGPTKIAHLLVI